MTPPSQPHWKAADYARDGAFVPRLGAAVLELLDPQSGEEILDVGCGDGALTAQIAAAGAKVLGIDPSAEMVAAARTRGLDVEQVGAAEMDYENRFNAAFSNAALHWIKDRDGAADAIYRALRPGARFVGEMGGMGNLAHLLGAIESEAEARGYAIGEGASNWYPSPAGLAAVYSRAGFVEIDAHLFDRPTPLDHGVEGWIRTFRSGWLDEIGMPEAERPDFTASVADRFGSDEADYVRLRFTMRKAD
ncbi:class I SAM-dependent methyltransferase [Sphingomicrobium lutaoense]|uniref:SAM-dependent methyltransferase n=1 Tax=Sphingomicrobium lutaoense TaxID=515949 RepID=A0A839YZS1_9SPHN|nr:class I SAM-dependent methyltransferase [Sphingomicrobium lutaoense]MBB3763950.1 SAM-dependent methyltransferase [Sphingomicrobium lutaoense]